MRVRLGAGGWWFALLGLVLVGSVSLGGGQPAGKKPIPNKTELTRAEALVRELYQKELAAAEKDRAAQAALAATLYREALDTRDDLAGRFVLLRDARDLAARAGEAALAL